MSLTTDVLCAGDKPDYGVHSGRWLTDVLLFLDKKGVDEMKYGPIRCYGYCQKHQIEENTTVKDRSKSVELQGPSCNPEPKVDGGRGWVSIGIDRKVRLRRS